MKCFCFLLVVMQGRTRIKHGGQPMVVQVVTFITEKVNETQIMIIIAVHYKLSYYNYVLKKMIPVICLILV